MKHKTLFKINFISHGKIYELYVRSVKPSEMFGFIEISDFVFGDANKVVVDPSEERLKTEFAGVGRSYIPLHAVVRIDEVKHEGVAKIINMSEKDGNVTLFPSPVYTPPDDAGRSK